MLANSITKIDMKVMFVGAVLPDRYSYLYHTSCLLLITFILGFSLKVKWNYKLHGIDLKRIS